MFILIEHLSIFRFNVDSLQQMPNMPIDLRKNNSGARILTLDEIERLQQSVYN